MMRKWIDLFEAGTKYHVNVMDGEYLEVLGADGELMFKALWDGKFAGHGGAIDAIQFLLDKSENPRPWSMPLPWTLMRDGNSLEILDAEGAPVFVVLWDGKLAGHGGIIDKIKSLLDQTNLPSSPE